MPLYHVAEISFLPTGPDDKPSHPVVWAIYDYSSILSWEKLWLKYRGHWNIPEKTKKEIRANARTQRHRDIAFFYKKEEAEQIIKNLNADRGRQNMGILKKTSLDLTGRIEVATLDGERVNLGKLLKRKTLFLLIRDEDKFQAEIQILPLQSDSSEGNLVPMTLVDLCKIRVQVVERI